MSVLSKVRVLDFTTLLPGPLATLILADAGAEIIKIERPRVGDEMRSYTPRFGNTSVNFAMLNRGKRSIELDLKAEGAVDQVMQLVRTADVLIEQFRPGVMSRLGLGYEAVSSVNPGLIYCSISGYGQSGPKAQVAAHDLNYIAETGLLSLAAGSDGAPVLPPALIADIGGGTYPAVMNILLALLERQTTGKGCYLDVAMADNLFPFMYWAIGNGSVANQWPVPGGELVTGGSPRYNIYRTADDRFVAAAPLEDKFWALFCVLIGLPEHLRDDSKDPQATIRGVADIIAGRDSSHWATVFRGKDVCCSIVRNLQEALQDEHFAARQVFARTLASQDQLTRALPTPIDRHFRQHLSECDASPDLGEGGPSFLSK